jgi:hypothetical protein
LCFEFHKIFLFSSNYNRFGYRFGDHADFQVQFELGPQKETQAIGDKASQSKRNVRPADEFQLEKALRKEEQKVRAKMP